MQASKHPFNRLLTAIIIGLAANPGIVFADDITVALTGGKAKLDIRYRYEEVDQGGVFARDNQATASTLRTRLGFETGSFYNLTGLIEMENIADAGADKYAPKKAGYPVIGDPTLTEMNQAWIQFAGIPKTQFKLGRQRLILDNARFVGNVGWRQNEQTFDAATIINQSIKDTTLQYSYLDASHTITGTAADTSSHLFNAKYTGLPLGAMTLYSYRLDFDPGFGTDTQTVGLRFDGKSDMGGDRSLLYTAEYATQADFQESANIDTDYQLLEGGVGISGITVKAGYELLGGADGGTAAFATPLATLHTFNGWADKFLTTPSLGLNDIYLSVGATAVGVNLMAMYHEFSSDQGRTDFGTETDLQALKKFGKNYAVGMKYAAFDKGSVSTYTETDKFWVWGELSIK